MLKELDLHVTNRCTARCGYCSYCSNQMDLPEMDLKTILDVLEQAKCLGVEHVHITGGEPLLREDIENIVRQIRRLRMHVRLQTNGMLLTNERIGSLKSAGVEDIMISLDSCEEECHERLRGRGTYDVTVGAIKKLLQSEIKLRVNSVICRSNMDKILDTIDFLYSMGVRNYSAFYFSPIGRGKEMREEWLEPEEYMNFWNRLQQELNVCREKYADMNIVIEKGYASWQEALYIDNKNFSGCGGGCASTYYNREYLIVRSDGNIYPCIMAVDHECLGNIFEDSLADIFYLSRNWMHLVDNMCEHCECCEYKIICNGGCRYYPGFGSRVTKHCHDGRCRQGYLVPLCPIMKYNMVTDRLGGSSEEVMFDCNRETETNERK